MNRPAHLLGGAFAVVVVTGFTMIEMPFLQFERTPKESGLTPPTNLQAAGRELYVSLGCSYCHSQQPRDRNFGPDETRGWGRAPTPGDYFYDAPHQLGTMRTGPDLFNIGARQASIDWHLTHLYQPRAVVPESIMPSFPFLFLHKEKAEPGDVLVGLPPGTAPAAGVIVATPDALALVAYLVGLDHTYRSDLIGSEPVPAEAEPASDTGGGP